MITGKSGTCQGNYKAAKNLSQRIIAVARTACRIAIHPAQPDVSTTTMSTPGTVSNSRFNKDASGDLLL
jgi:hypothetical protein